MTLATHDEYGAPAYGPIGRPPAGVIFHTPENVDHTLEQAIAVARWQGTPANSSGGSYHGILGFDASRGTMDDADAWVMVRSVPWDQAAGGLSSQRVNPPWAPDRYPFIRELLPDEAFRDPNRWLHQISLGGKAGWYVANGYPAGLVTRTAEWVAVLEGAYGYDAILTLHRQWQTDRSDPGPETFIGLVMDEYHRLSTGTQPAPEPPLRFSDVTPAHWAYESIEWAADNGIASGRPDGTFGPDEPATRAQIVTFLHRYSQIVGEPMSMVEALKVLEL